MRTAANRFAASLTVLLLALASSCSEPRKQESTSSQEPVGAKAAASITEYIDLMLREDDDMDPNQRTVLEKARGNGGSISQGDYVAAWMAYRQCMVDKGYADPPLHRVNGIYLGTVKTSSSGMSEAQTRKLDDDFAYCQTYHVSSVDVIYRMNIGNPQLYSNSDEALVDCLHRHDLVPKEYNAERFNKESLSNTYSFDFSDSQTRTCIATTAPTLLMGEVEPWEPYKTSGGMQSARP